MNSFILFAKPWWVNLLILVPLGLFWFWRKNRLAISSSQLLAAGIFGVAFGFLEAAVVIYLRAALGVLPGFQMLQVIQTIPQQLLRVELWREAATIVMLLSVAFLAAKDTRDRAAMFLWMFAAWDFFFYVSLWLVIGWPFSFTTTDILFLIPVPWVAQVWFPLSVSLLMIVAVALSRERGSSK